MTNSVSGWACLPFFVLLICIAIFPLWSVTKHLWEKRLFQLAVALVLGLPVGLWMCLSGNPNSVVHAVIEYVQFIALLFALFVVSGGICVTGDLKARPAVNVAFLALGALLSSLIGTTGAAMLLIRPIIKTNQQRKHTVHTIVFAIFMIANCGGLLTPLGDPPLFLGMLRGVPFTWTLHLFPEWLFVNGLLLLLYWGIDRRAYARESDEAIASDLREGEPIRLVGKLQFLNFAVIIAAVAFLPSIQLDAIHHGSARWFDWLPWREVVMLLVAFASLFLGDRDVRWKQNRFCWGPIQEVAAIFSGIFLAMIPALQFLRQIAPSLPLDEVTFFLFTGGLSSVLDNAPTYVTFFEMAGAMPTAGARIAGVPAAYLASISIGAVFGGAITYIGNGPNFMVKAVAEGAGIAMPSFGGYILRWSLPLYVPVLLSMALIFIVPGFASTLLGVGLALGLAAHALYAGLRARRPFNAPSGSQESP